MVAMFALRSETLFLERGEEPSMTEATLDLMVVKIVEPRLIKMRKMMEMLFKIVNPWKTPMSRDLLKIFLRLLETSLKKLRNPSVKKLKANAKAILTKNWSVIPT